MDANYEFLGDVMLVQLFGMPVETEKSFCCDINTGSTKLNMRQVYLPKSLCRLASPDGLDYHGGDVFIDVPAWLAKKNNL